MAPTDADLREATEVALAGHFGSERAIARLERRLSPYQTSFALEEVAAHLADGTVLPVLFKNVGWGALGDAARRAKPSFLHDPEREIRTYREILTPNSQGTAACYGSVLDRGRDRFWLFLEHVAGQELYQIGEIAVWQQVARWLAAFHTSYASPAALSIWPAAVRALTFDRAYFEGWPRRALSFARRRDKDRAPGTGGALDRLAARYAPAVEHLLSLPPTLLHGDFYASNVIVQERDGILRVCPIDWELTAVGPGLIDLAALTAGKWSETDRTAIALAYHEVLVAISDQVQPSADDFLVSLDYCRLHLAWQWLGWSPGWSPPREHDQDWLGQALELADTLGL